MRWLSTVSWSLMRVGRVSARLIEPRGPDAASVQHGPRLGRPTWPLLLSIVALGSLLRVYRIGSPGLWIDEAFSIWLARHPLREMLHWVSRVDHHPPLYYGLLHVWTALLGSSEAAARALSALFGAATIPVVYLLGRRVVDASVGVVAALVLAISPFHIRFAQEARMYTLLTLCASLALYASVTLWGQQRRPSSVPQACVLDAVGPYGTVRRAGKSWLPWVGYVACTVAALWTHNTAILLPIAANVLVLGRAVLRGRLPGRKAPAAVDPEQDGEEGVTWRRRWLVAQVAVLVLWLPWVASFISQALDVYHRFWLPVPTLGTILSIVGAFLSGSLPGPFWVVLVADVGLATLALLGVRELYRRSASAAVLGAAFVVPFVGQWLASQWRPVLYARTLIWTSIPLYVMLGAGVGWLRTKVLVRMGSSAVTVIVLAGLVAINSVALANYYVTFEKEAWDDAAALVAERVRPDDLLLFGDSWGQIPFDYYFRQLYNSGEDQGIAEHGLPVDLFERGVLEPAMTERDLARLHKLVAGRRRVWLIYSHQWYTDPEGLIPDALTTALTLRRQWVFEGLQVHLYVEE